MPKVSICVPVYNVEEYIENSAKSLFEQSLNDLEYIFVDDSSKDASIKNLRRVAEKYPELKDKIRIVEQSENQGPWVARKVAAEMATGEYIYFPDSDDILDVSMMEKMYNKAISEKADIVLCNVEFQYNTHNEVRKIAHIDDDQWLPSLFTSKAPQALWWRLIKRDIVQLAFSTYIQLQLIRFEDFLLSVKCHFYARHVEYVDEVLYFKNDKNMGSLTHTPSLKAIESAIIVGEELGKFFHSKSLYEKFSSEINGFKYGAIFPYGFTSENWKPEAWRKYADSIELGKVKNYPSKVPKVYRKFQEQLLLNRYDKIAFANMRLMEITKEIIRNFVHIK